MTYIAERRQEERDRRRNEIVDAAEALYAEVGWDAVTMDQVARRARLSRALVYVYFHDKADLHFALVERSLEELRRRFEAAHEGKVRGTIALDAAAQRPTTSINLVFDGVSLQPLLKEAGAEGLEGRAPLSELRAGFGFVRGHPGTADRRNQTRGQDADHRDRDVDPRNVL